MPSGVISESHCNWVGLPVAALANPGRTQTTIPRAHRFFTLHKRFHFLFKFRGSLSTGKTASRHLLLQLPTCRCPAQRLSLLTVTGPSRPEGSSGELAL